MTHDKLAWLKCSSRWIVGRATFTMVWSSEFMSMAKQTTTRAIQRRRSPAKALRICEFHGPPQRKCWTRSSITGDNELISLI